MADDEIPLTRTVSETTTGGGSTTISTGTKKVDTPASLEWQTHVNNLQAENDQHVAQLKAEGKSFQEIQHDDVYQANKQEIREAKANVDSSKTTVETWTNTRNDITGQTVGQPHVTETTFESVSTQPDLTPKVIAPPSQQAEIANTQESVAQPQTSAVAPTPEPPSDMIYNDMGELVPRDEMALDDPRWAEQQTSDSVLSHADDPSMAWDDDLGEYVPKEDIPDNWDDGTPPLLPSEDPSMVWDDDLGEYVPKEDMPSEEQWQTNPEIPDDYVDEWGCKQGEHWDDDAMYCVPNFEPEPVEPPPYKPVPKDVYSARRAKANNKALNDWRVRLSLAPQAEYLYNKPGYAGILEPLRETDGIIFPYVPRIDTIYHATYNSYDLTHSNYRGYFYQNSYPGEMLINATFTAQDTKEANYLLAVIHFIRSCTKMFYGQDHGNPHRGSPPPLVFLRGLGEHQFNEHPCVVSLMNYNLPDDVDYIKASVGGSLGADTDPFRMNNENKPTGHQSWSSKISRLWQSGLEPGASPTSFTPDAGGNMTIKGRYRGDQGVSRVPTKLDISFNLLPIQTRDQVSNQYSMDKYGTGELLKKGFY